MINQTELIKYLADKNGRVSPQEIFKRIKQIAFVSLIGLFVSLLFLYFAMNSAPLEEQTRMLFGLCIVTSGVVFIFGLVAMCVLLWESFVSTYIANLDLKNDMCELHEETNHSELTIILTEIRNELQQAADTNYDDRAVTEIRVNNAISLCINSEQKLA